MSVGHCKTFFSAARYSPATSNLPRNVSSTVIECCTPRFSPMLTTIACDPQERAWETRRLTQCGCRSLERTPSTHLISELSFSMSLTDSCASPRRIMKNESASAPLWQMYCCRSHRHRRGRPCRQRYPRRQRLHRLNGKPRTPAGIVSSFMEFTRCISSDRVPHTYRYTHTARQPVQGNREREKPTGAAVGSSQPASRMRSGRRALTHLGPLAEEERVL